VESPLVEEQGGGSGRGFKGDQVHVWLKKYIFCVLRVHGCTCTYFCTYL